MTSEDYSTNSENFESFCAGLDADAAKPLRQFFQTHALCQLISRHGMESKLISLIYDPWAELGVTKEAKRSLIQLVLENNHPPDRRGKAAQLSVATTLSQLAFALNDQAQIGVGGKLRRPNPRGSTGNVFPEGI